MLRALWKLAIATMLLGMASACESEHTEANDYCAFSERTILFIVDRTTRYDALDRESILINLGTAVDRLRPGDRFIIAPIGAHYSTAVAQFDDCMPGCPAGGGLLESCSRTLARANARAFRQGLVQALRPMTVNETELPNSDITGSLRRLSILPPGAQPVSDVYIFSDMLENSQSLSWGDMRSLSLTELSTLVDERGLYANFHGARIHISGFGRLHDPGRPPLDPELDQKLRSFWDLYFQGSGATVDAF